MQDAAGIRCGRSRRVRWFSPDGASGAPDAAALAGYVASVDAALAETPLEDFATGRFRFPEGLIASGG
jgi:hypothetical protein